MNDIASYMLEQTKKILSIDSPTGFTAHAAEYVLGAYKKLGYDAKLTNKGGIFVCVNDGPDQADDPADAPILLEAHMDTLGGMVCSINEKGRLMLSALGGMNPNNAEAENCRVYTRSGKVYSGTFQLKNASIHVNGSYNDTARSYDAMEVVLDEPVESKADTEALGIMTGDIVCFDPRTTVTESGYIKSRFLDDKLSVGILLGVIALSGSLGTPWPWLRLSVIGALHYETQVAQAAAEQVGMHALSAAEMTPQGFTTIALLMSVCIMWGMILSIFFNKRYLKRLGNDGAKSASGVGFGDSAMTAMFIGLVCAYIGSYIGAFVSGEGLFTCTGDWTPLIVVVVSAAVMALFVYLSEKKNMAWLESFSIAGSMLIGMAAAVLVRL